MEKSKFDKSCECGCGTKVTNRFAKGHNWKTKEGRKARSEHKKQQWQDPEYRENIRTKNSISVSKLWTDPAYRENRKEADELAKPKIAAKTRLQWQNQEFRDMMSKGKNFFGKQL